MKRVLTLLALAAVVFVSSCKGGGTSTKLSGPEAAAKAAIEAIKKGDMKAFINTYNLSDDDKATLSALMEDKLTKELDKKGGIKSYEFIDIVYFSSGIFSDGCGRWTICVSYRQRLSAERHSFLRPSEWLYHDRATESDDGRKQRRNGMVARRGADDIIQS